MDEVLADHKETANNIEMRLLRRVASLSETEISKRMNCDKSTVSRFISDRLPQVVKFITACDLQLVDASDDAGVVTISSEEYKSLNALLRIKL